MGPGAAGDRAEDVRGGPPPPAAPQPTEQRVGTPRGDLGVRGAPGRRTRPSGLILPLGLPGWDPAVTGRWGVGVSTTQRMDLTRLPRAEVRLEMTAWHGACPGPAPEAVPSLWSHGHSCRDAGQLDVSLGSTGRAQPSAQPQLTGRASGCLSRRRGRRQRRWRARASGRACRPDDEDDGTTTTTQRWT